MANVICMKWGTAYGPEYVNILHSMVARNLTRPFRFVCFTDDRTGIDRSIECLPMPEVPLPEAKKNRPWRKIGTFAPGLGGLEGPTLFLDLDLIITGNIDGFFEHPGAFCIIENWTTPGRGVGNSSVYRYDPARFTFVYERFVADPEGMIAAYPNSQTFVSKTVGNPTYWPDAWCRSFKRHCLPGGVMNWIKRPAMPPDAKIIVFHGHPNPPDAARGVWPQRHKHLRAAPWIYDHWR